MNSERQKTKGAPHFVMIRLFLMSRVKPRLIGKRIKEHCIINMLMLLPIVCSYAAEEGSGKWIILRALKIDFWKY